MKIREKILKLYKITEAIDELLDDKELTKEEILDSLLNIYYDYCAVTGGHSTSDVSDRLYRLAEEDGINMKKSELKDGIESIQSEVYEKVHSLKYEHGIIIDIEDISLSSKTGKLIHKFNKDFEGYSSDKQAQEKSTKRQSKVQSKFFDGNRINNPTANARNLRQTYEYNRVTSSQTLVIDTTNIPGRSIIAEDATSLKNQLEALTPAHYKSKELPRYLFHSRNGRNFNREKVQRGSTQITSQYQPSQNNLGNFIDTGLGRYGFDFSKKGRGYIPNILEVIRSLTQGNSILEQRLAALFIHYIRNGFGFHETILTQNQFYLPTEPKKRTQIINQLNHIVHTCCLKEVSRRMNHGFNLYNDGSFEKVLELPFGTVGAMALKLLKDGYLKMKDVFDADAKYGVFTGQSIMSAENLHHTLSKFKAVAEYYNQCYKPEESFVFELEHDEEGIIPTQEHLHKLCGEIYGGEYDSEGEEYLSSDDEDNKLSNQVRRFSI